jgi:hypothetical protein
MPVGPDGAFFCREKNPPVRPAGAHDVLKVRTISRASDCEA